VPTQSEEGSGQAIKPIILVVSEPEKLGKRINACVTSQVAFVLRYCSCQSPISAFNTLSRLSKIPDKDAWHMHELSISYACYLS
jgi:hypothetical protein